MKSHITTREEYSELFPDKKTALDVAREERKFQIELYWRKITYYWALLAAIFIGFFSLPDSDLAEVKLYSVVVSALGLIISIAWYFMNRSAAYWHYNWDAHVHELEEHEVGPLHRTRLENSLFTLKDIALPYRTSSTKLNNIVSLYVCILWLFLFAYTLFDLFKTRKLSPILFGFFLACTTFYFISALIRGSKAGRLSPKFKIEEETLPPR